MTIVGTWRLVFREERLSTLPLKDKHVRHNTHNSYQVRGRDASYVVALMSEREAILGCFGRSQSYA